MSSAALSMWLAYAWHPGQQGSFDSAFYVDGARHLASGEGYVSALTEPDSTAPAPVIRWAPGFPALTALIKVLFRVSVLNAAAYTLSLSYISLVLGTLWLSSLLFRPNTWALSLLCGLLVACNRQVLTALDVLLSDLPFGALAILGTAAAVRLARAARWSWYYVLGFAALLTALFAVRYAGALYIPGLLVAMALAMLMRRQGLALVLWNLGRVVFVVAGLLSLWVMRNLQYGELPFGARIPIHDPWPLHATRALHGIFPWWFALQDVAHKQGMQPLVTWVSVGIGVVSAILLVQRSTRLWECLLFTLLPAAMYALLMVIAASHVKFDPIQNARFWIPMWPLTFIAAAGIAARSTTHWRTALSSVLVAALLLGAYSELQWLRHALPRADQAGGLLSPAWHAAAQSVPAPRDCRLFTTDVRPLMLHRRLGPSSEIPLTLSDFDRAARKHASLCIATFSKKLRVSSSAERRRVEQNHVVAQLQRAGRLEQLSSRAGVTVYRLRHETSDCQSDCQPR